MIRIRRAKLKFEGWFYKPWLTYEVQTNWPGISSANLANYLEDANINWDVTKGKKQFMVKLGQYKVPFGLQELVSSGSQQLVDRSLVSNSYFRGRDTGVSVWGVLGNNKLEYRAGLFNGNGLTRSANDNDKFQYNARVQFHPNGDGLDDELVLAGLFHHQPGDAARGVAAGFGFRTVLVPDAHEDVAAQGRFHGDDLVGPGAGFGVGDGFYLVRREAEILLPSVKYDEGVAGPIHLPEFHDVRCKGLRGGRE